MSKTMMVAAGLSALALFASGEGRAAPLLKLVLSGTVDAQYDYASGSYEPLPVASPVTITAWTALDPYVVQPNSVAISVMYPQGKAGIDDPLLPFVGPDPFGPGLANLADSGIAFATVQDHSAVFREYLSITQQAYSSDGSTTWSYRSDLFIESLGPPKSGDGSDNYAMTPSALIDFLDGRIGKPTGTFQTSWSVFVPSSDWEIPPSYTAGKAWRSTDVTLLSYEIVDVSAVPEPANWALMTIGIFTMGAAMRRRPAAVRFA